jgi:putative oxidoreductase
VNQENPSRKGGAVAVAGVLGRVALGVFFIYMGLGKAIHPVDFLKLLRQYELTQAPWLLNSVAATLPWFEIVCGILLVTGVGVRGVSLILAILLAAFTAVVFQRALGLHAALAIPFCAVKFDCGCGSGEVFICRKLVENLAQLALCGCLLAGAGSRACLRYRLL